jgi:hypothetical protein
MMWKEVDVTWFNVLSRHLPEGIEEKIVGVPSRDSNLTSPEYKIIVAPGASLSVRTGFEI